MAKPLLICLLGPTASGKTDLAVSLAQALDAELISVDSALVYRGLDIGSAKPDFPHHLVDIRDPQEVYSAADFVGDTSALVADITARGKTPLLVGGTMLYFKAYLQGLSEMPAADPEIRAEIEAEARKAGWPRLHSELARVDPLSAERIHPNHSQRIGRALEVFRSSGVSMSTWQQAEPPHDLPSKRYRVLQLAICPQDRGVLHERIAKRFHQMMAQGFLEEVRCLYQEYGEHRDLPALRAVGYRQLWQHLSGEIQLEEAVERGIAATRQLAKRQLTWLRKWPDLQWICTDDAGNVVETTLSHSRGADSLRNPVDLVLNYLT